MAVFGGVAVILNAKFLDRVDGWEDDVDAVTKIAGGVGVVVDSGRRFAGFGCR